MIVTLWRHGEAERGVNDRLRQLTAKGRNDVSVGSREFNKACGAKGIAKPQKILHSPWVRTRQTTEIIGSAFSRATVVAADALRPDSDVTDLDRLICADRDAKHIVLVLHQPLVSRVVAYYLGDIGSVPFINPGGLVVMSLDTIAAGCGTTLFWAFPPTYQQCT